MYCEVSVSKQLLLLGYNTVCYGELGCFTDGPPYGDTSERPISHLPDDPEKINARFYLDTATAKGREVFYNNMQDLR